MSNENLNISAWDYTEQAKYYYLRPNYSPIAIDKLLLYVNAKKESNDYVVADIGAGTGNLSVMLEERGLSVTSVEPNLAMRNIGIERTKGKKILWKAGTGEKNTLESNSLDLITFGSSFNTTDRDNSLKESYRVLKDDGFFCCMWNNRDLENDKTQLLVESIIKKYVPLYSHGTRRENQTSFIEESKLFKDIYYIEEPQLVKIELENYIDAWKSVKNNFWDLSTLEGKELFEKILFDIRKEFLELGYLNLTYVTKIWIAQKNN